MYKFRSARVILPADVLNALSTPARSLYSRVWNRMAYLGKTEVALANGDTMRRAYIDDLQLEACQHELVSAGLLNIQFDHRPGSVLRAQCPTYRFPETDEEAAA